MNVSNLSTGDKLSLKGKIFELSKKLNEIDSQSNDIKSNSFKPTITSYYLPDRQNDFISNIKKAEEMRKQKLNSIKRTVEIEKSKSLTFSPAINNYKLKSDNKPVYDRLYEKAIETRSKLEDRRKKANEYDYDGNRLFTPELIKSPSNKYNNLSSNITAEEYLYRDALDREERHRQREKEKLSEIDDNASAIKINSYSQALLKKKAEREVRLVFDKICSNESNTIGYQDIQAIVQLLVNNGKISIENKYKLSERLWMILDRDKAGEVDLTGFMKVFYPCAYRLAVTMSWTDAITSSTQSNTWDNKDNIFVLKSFFQDILSFIQQTQPNNEPINTVFSPKINKRSRQLAKKKELDDIKQLKEVITIDLNDHTSTDLMHARHHLSQIKLNQLKKKIEDNQIAECSFHPEITNKAKNLVFSENSIIDDNDNDNDNENGTVTSNNQNRSIRSIPVHDRLYSLRDKPKPTHDMANALTNELKDCTFTPVLPSRKLRSELKPGAVPLAKAFDKNVQRITNARIEKEKLQLENEKNQFISDERYQRSRQLLVDGPKPFSFTTDKRQKEKLTKSRGPPKLYVDVKLGLARIGHIKIRDNDDPDELAKCFCRVYSLDEVAKSVLANAARESMIAHSIAIQGQSNNPDEYDSNYTFSVTNSDFESDSDYSDEQIESHEITV